MKKTCSALALFALCLSAAPTREPGPKPNLLPPTSFVVGSLGLAFLAWTQVNPRLSFWEPIGLPRYLHNITRPPRWDHDYWVLDYFAHPACGSEYFLLFRNEGFPFLTSLLCSALSSALWEYGYEAFAERPSFQDLILTPLIGSLIGEVRYQVCYSIRRSEALSPLARKLITALIDPIDLLMAPWRMARFRKEQRNLVLSRASGGLGLHPERGLSFDFQAQWEF